MLKLITVSGIMIISLANLSENFFQKPSTARQVETYFTRSLEDVLSTLEKLTVATENHADRKNLQKWFIISREAYKRAECIIEYYYPYLLRKINGPPLPFADGENSFAVIEPEGYQVIEELLFTGIREIDQQEIREKIQALKVQFRSIRDQQDPYLFQDRYILEAIRFELFRIVALGITGFDSQAALHSIPESAAAMQSLQKLLSFYTITLSDTAFTGKLNRMAASAVRYLQIHAEFEKFDRLTFITEYADPLGKEIQLLIKKLHMDLPAERRILSPLAPDLFATQYLNPSGYSPNEEANATPAKIRLGEKLFFDQQLSATHTRSCASCHQPARAFTDGLPKSISLDNLTPVARNAPTLWNAAFQPKQFYDSRANFMEHQVFEVVHNRQEMGGSLKQLVQVCSGDKTYNALFRTAYGKSDSAVSEENIVNAIASFLRSLVSLNARFDRYLNGNRKSMNEEEKKGFNLFMGKAKCATCHYVPLFNGVAPPYFSESESEVIGVPASTDTLHPAIDEDRGKFNLYPISIFDHSFKTPTLRNISLTAPYMHNGVYKTLPEVIEFYDKGGGAGLGIVLPGQTLPASPLHLTGKEKSQLLAFLGALTDTSGIKRSR